MSQSSKRTSIPYLWRKVFLLLLIFSVACLAFLLFYPQTQATLGSKVVDVSLHSVLEANYNSDRPTVVPGVELSLIADTLLDKEPNAKDIEARVATVLDNLQTPVTNVGPATATPTSTPTSSPTSIPSPSATVTATLTPSPSPAPSATPMATATEISLPISTSTLVPIATDTPTPTTTPTISPSSSPTFSPTPVSIILPTDTPTPTTTIEVDGTWTVRELDPLPLGGWGSVIRVWVRGKVGHPVILTATDGGWETVAIVGEKEEYGPDAVEFAPLSAGRYTIYPQGVDISLSIELEPGQVAQILFEQE